MFLCLYKSLVRPYLEYATTVLSPMFKKDSIILENIKRRATSENGEYIINTNIWAASSDFVSSSIPS